MFPVPPGLILIFLLVVLPIAAIVMAKRRKQKESISPIRRRVRGLVALALAIIISSGVLVGLASTYVSWGAMGFSDRYGVFQLFWSGVWLFFAGALFYFYWSDRRG